MEKYLWKIINKLSICLFTLSVVLLLIFVFIITINNFRYYNQYIEGVVISSKSRGASSSDGPLYREFVYKIDVDNELFTAVDSEKNIKVGDKVFCKKTASKLLKIIKVNSKKINNEYNIIDLISLTISLLVLFLIFLFIKNKLK